MDIATWHLGATGFLAALNVGVLLVTLKTRADIADLKVYMYRHFIPRRDLSSLPERDS